MAKVINVANFKGGVGKTTTSVMLSYLLAEKNYRVLFLDFDPQGNGTDFLLRKTFKLERPQTSIYDALEAQDISKAVYSLNEYLSIVPADWSLKNFPRLLSTRFGNDYNMYGFLLDAALYPVKDHFDFIFIDVPPTLSDFTDNAIVAADELIIVMQTHEFSLGAAEDFVPYINQTLENFTTDVNLLAVVPVLMNSSGRTDKFILEEAKKAFGDKMVSSQIKIRERVKAWGVTGIRNEDMHDEAVLAMYNELADEILTRLKKPRLNNLEV